MNWKYFSSSGSCGCEDIILGVGASSIRDGLKYFLFALLIAGILRGLWYFVSSLLHTYRFQKNIKAYGEEKDILVHGKKYKLILLKNHYKEAFTFGFFSPRIVLSERVWQECRQEERTALLKHEAYHNDHRDPFRFFLLDILGKTFFYLPFLNYVIERYRAIRELRADEAAGNSEHLGNALLYMLSESVSSKVPQASFASLLDIRIARLRGQNPRSFARISFLQIMVSTTFMVVFGMLFLWQPSSSFKTVCTASAPCASPSQEYTPAVYSIEPYYEY